ncbi:nuclear transport factor 2 family protein [Humibacter ginsenosidimutans]|uniref:Nuclear transport factor 2 family protein n=2 Tax=Humibacter ginsenosidimutans TaxID=2599293 RepID=A0A5B8MBF0_9MICO|nr:nuclear transport factor 2 family protein [Humibacter ginsenosidimutans]
MDETTAVEDARDGATTPSQVVTGFVAAFGTREAARLAPYLHEDIEFQAYGDAPVHGRDAVLAIWAGVFASMAAVEFRTLNRATNGDLVIEEQVHGLGLPGRPVAPIRNMAVYRVQHGRIIEWRDYTNPEYARTLM